MTSDFTSVFLAFFVLTVAIRLWLKWRHIAFVTSHRAAVPASFAERIDLPSHQKAADYTIARCKMAVFDILVEAGLLLIPSHRSVTAPDEFGNTTVTVDYTLAHKDGEVWPEKITVVGCGNDKNSKGGVGDKGIYKAATGAKLTRPEELRLELMEKINALGVGAQGLGGLTTVLDVKIAMFPTHAASKPVANTMTSTSTLRLPVVMPLAVIVLIGSRRRLTSVTFGRL